MGRDELSHQPGPQPQGADEAGATPVEYAFLAALVAAVIPRIAGVFGYRGARSLRHHRKRFHMMWRLHHYGDRGAAAVEFALILPILIALVGAVIDFGFAFNAHVGLAHAAREGVRVEAIGTGDGRTTALNAFVPLAVTGEDANVDQSCPNTVDNNAVVRIWASYDYFILPFSPTTFENEAVMRCGG